MPEQYKRKPNSKCAICQKEIYRRPFELEKNKGIVYCSARCFGFSCRKETTCSVCNKSILARENKRTCSRACSNKSRTGTTYKNILGPRKDKVKNARLLKNHIMNKRGTVCERCDFNIFQILQVHHKDRNTEHNSLNNLELLCPNCHAKEHYLKN